MQAKLIEIKPLHSCLIQLNHIMYRLSWSNVFQEQLNQEMANLDQTKDLEIQSKLMQARSMMYLDYILLNLNQLVEIHDSQLGKVLNEIDYKELLQCLEEIWNPIKKLRNKIELWRNNYVAHGKKQASEFRTLKEIDSDYEDTIKKTYFASRLATIYIATIFKNLQSDYKHAISLQKLRMASHGGEWVWRDYDQYWEEMKRKEDDLTKQVNKLLYKNGYEQTAKPDFIGQNST